MEILMDYIEEALARIQRQMLEWMKNRNK